MNEPHILRATRNPRSIKRNLVHVVDAPAIDAIEEEIRNNTVQPYSLGLQHYRFAKQRARRIWRQCVSRLYYAAYNMARAVRLFVDGDYSAQTTDHRKFTNLPADFPNRLTYANRLTVLREDRNLCDYDHAADRADLVIGVSESIELVEDFMQDTKVYLKNRGLSL